MSYFSNLEQYCERLEAENNYLRMRLEESEKRYSDFLNNTVNATINVTNEWIKVLISGDLKVK
jgi:hypothetical protein